MQQSIISDIFIKPKQFELEKPQKFNLEIKDRHICLTDKRITMNYFLYMILRIMVNISQHDYDNVMIIDGEKEGCGKSTLAQQIAYFFSWTFKKKLKLENIVFTPQQFIDAIDKAERFDTIIWDEAYSGGSKWRVISAINQEINKNIMKIRQKNLFLILVLPSYFDLNQYLSKYRSFCLLHVDIYAITEDFIRKRYNFDIQRVLDVNDVPFYLRGFFSFYSYNKKNEMYNKFKQNYHYGIAPDFQGMFTGGYCVDEQAYRDKKKEFAVEEDEQPQKKASIFNPLPKNLLIAELLKKGLDTKEIMRISESNPAYISSIKAQLNSKIDNIDDNQRELNSY